jgi:hypothetical protein
VRVVAISQTASGASEAVVSPLELVRMTWPAPDIPVERYRVRCICNGYRQ